MFLASKLLTAITQPMFWLALWWALSLLVLLRWRKAALFMLWSGLLVLGLLGFRAIPDALLRPLENRYPVPAAQAIDRHVGIIVLGGALGHPASFVAHGQVPLGEAAERMTVPVGLMRQHPGLELVFSGGEGRLLRTGVTEAELARAFYQQQGLDMSKVRLENGSRNTRENAQQVARLLGARCQEPWLLVTSAWHMPRAVAEFEAVACKVTPYPVDFRTGTSTPLTEYSLAHSLLRWQTALHEWLGLWVYGITR
ncbi:YdcF family protein [Serpentinimonas barnesii]|uniref:YdcF family protein n=1 Tax=Serpentinimonas barnesii TaxID=1458427 RepID=UPI0005EEA48C|nr:YdcF family protein [Serpentinimonas barnesii]